MEPRHELRSMLAVHPDDANAQWFLGFALIDNGRSEEAIPVLEKTVSIRSSKFLDWILRV
jgi:cytochrome c-type biogenesis protein CcmH/NrfG